ncbi:MAG: hypothetical protein P8I11_07180 [Bacteroidia bacterium]|nr:hypothetical protein [Bacteroidia bacterium]
MIISKVKFLGSIILLMVWLVNAQKTMQWSLDGYVKNDNDGCEK